METPSKHIPLSIVHLTGYTSPNSNALSTLMYGLGKSDLVSAYGFCSSDKDAIRLIDEGKVNTLSIDLAYFTPDGWFSGRDFSAKDAHAFISNVRKKYPQVVIVLYTRRVLYELLCEFNSKYEHYFFLPEEERGRYSEWLAMGPLTPILDKCENWFFKFFEYDIAISYAGEDREHAERVATALKERSTRVFYDRFEHEMSAALGQDLVSYLSHIYRGKARLCLVLVSQAYVQKRWTMFELGLIQERINLQPALEYIIPVKIDDATLPDISETIVYLDMKIGIEKVVDLIEKKLWILDNNTPKRRLTNWWW